MNNELKLKERAFETKLYFPSFYITKLFQWKATQTGLAVNLDFRLLYFHINVLIDQINQYRKVYNLQM